MASHIRAPSDSSTLTSLSEPSDDGSASSVVSEASVRSDDFRQKIVRLMENDNLRMNVLESRARDFIDALKNGAYDTPELKAELYQKMKLHRVLLAMLEYAPTEEGKRYTACAICACDSGDTSNGADRETSKLTFLRALSTTWLSHLLFVFKANSSHKTQPNRTPSDIATPTRDDTSTFMITGASVNHLDSLRTQVLERDDYRCVVSRRYDTNHPAIPDDQRDHRVDLEVCHILRRAVAVYKGGSTFSTYSDDYYSALTTFDILRNYASLPTKTIDDMANIIDHPSNVITLEKNAHSGYDKFRWCLKETENPNKYLTEIYDGAHGLQDPPFRDKIVTFEDHREAPNQSDLPNRQFIKIHAAIAGVLHMSGAGECIDRILNRSNNNGTGNAFTGDDFATLSLKEEVTANLRQIIVH